MEDLILYLVNIATYYRKTDDHLYNTAA